MNVQYIFSIKTISYDLMQMKSVLSLTNRNFIAMISLAISILNLEISTYLRGIHTVNMFLCKGNVAKSINLVHKFNYYMASSASGQDERILCSDWLPKRARWAHLACSRFPALIPKEKILF